MKTKPKTLLILTFFILLALILLSIYLLSLEENEQNNNEDKETKNAVYVTKVIDGDTFEMSDNATIRLLCVDAPEKGKSGYEEAKDFLADMILDKEVKLENDISDKDEYGRLLRYVYVNISGIEFFVNQQLVQEGHAKVFRYGNDTSKCDEIEGL